MPRLNAEQKEALYKNPVKLVPLDSFESQGLMGGLELPDGTRMIFDGDASGYVEKLWAIQLNARLFIVRGTLTFTPDLNTIKYPKETNHE